MKKKPHKRMNRGGGAKTYSATPSRPMPGRSVRGDLMGGSMGSGMGGASRMRNNISKRIASAPQPQPKPVDMDRGSLRAPMPMASMSPKGGISEMQGIIGGRGAPVDKGDTVSTMPASPPMKGPMPVSTTKLPMALSGVLPGISGGGPSPMARSQSQKIIAGGAADPGGREYFGRGGPMAGGVGAALGMKKGGAVKSKKMRGGGLARKGVGMALAKGGMVKANGCAQRGKTRGKMV